MLARTHTKGFEQPTCVIIKQFKKQIQKSYSRRLFLREGAKIAVRQR